jgi:hypothetical protein
MSILGQEAHPDRRIASPVRVLEEFKTSSIWEDLSEELKIWLGLIHFQLEDSQLELTDKELHRLGGNAEAIRHMQGIIDYLILNRTQQDEEEEKDDDRTRDS